MEREPGEVSVRLSPELAGEILKDWITWAVGEASEAVRW
jgi:hypothetical protein